ncbi:UNVERIFIED_CONTAM: hypothetical protein RF648_20855, partial [Kocuria sp. CPCC 205274]
MDEARTTIMLLHDNGLCWSLLIHHRRLLWLLFRLHIYNLRWLLSRLSLNNLRSWHRICVLHLTLIIITPRSGYYYDGKKKELNR